MVLGLVLVGVVVVWLATRPSLSTQARIQESHFATGRKMPTRPHRQNVESEQESVRQPSSPAITKSGDNEQPAANHKREDRRFHIVRGGESLSDISYKYYGTANQWHKIYNANRDVIKSADKLAPETKLIIPE